MNRILVTNDDGVHSDGIHALASALTSLGEVIIVAPHVEASAIGHALTLRRPLRMERLRDGVYEVDGTPTDCVNVAITQVYTPSSAPDLIVSGINKGYNLGDDVTYSGTVSGALEGSLLGIPEHRGVARADAWQLRFRPCRNGGRRDRSHGASRGDRFDADVPQYQCASRQTEGLPADGPGQAQPHHHRRSADRSARTAVLLD